MQLQHHQQMQQDDVQISCWEFLRAVLIMRENENNAEVIQLLFIKVKEV